MNRDRRPEDTCPPALPNPFRMGAAPERPTPACDPAVESLPDVFTPPTPCVDPVLPPSLLPDPLEIRSELLVLSCAEVDDAGPHGDNVEVVEGQFRTNVYFQQLTGITPEQLDFLAGLTPQERSTLIDSLTSEAEMRRITHLTPAQVAELMDALVVARALVAGQALDYATRIIRCVFYNDPQTAECAAGALASPEVALVEYHNPVVIPYGEFEGSTLAEANAQALAFAESLLICVWPNEEQTLTCVDEGFAEEVPNDPTPVGLADRVRVGTVVIPAGTHFSTDGQEEANEIALAAARGLLDCFYLNPAVSKSCADEGKPTALLQPVTALSGFPGNPVEIPTGFILSNESTAAALAAAELLADSLLDCYWVNQSQTATCPTVLWEGIEVAAHESSPTPTVTVAAGTIRSDISQDDANAQALLQAQLSLNCIYCNPEIPPTCLPGDLVDPPIPIPVSLVTGDWSVDATPGLAAETFCGAEALSILAFAQQVATTPLTPPTLPAPEGCEYTNDETVAACVKEEGVLVWRFEDEGTRTQLDPNSVPKPTASAFAERVVIIPAGQFSVRADQVPEDFEPLATNRVKLWANHLAELNALGQLDCYFSNDEQSIGCSLTPSESGPDILVSGNNLTIPAGVFTSPTSKEAANEAAIAALSGTVVCLWGSREVQHNGCGEGLVSVGPTSLPEGFATSPINSDHATFLAQTALNAMVQCVDPDDSPFQGEQGPPGEPGDPGAQTGCSGTCYGFFS